MVIRLSDRFAGFVSGGGPGFVCRESMDSDIYRSPKNVRSDIPNDKDQPPKLLDRLKEALRARHYSPRTEITY
jgi:hypothetical protein